MQAQFQGGALVSHNPSFARRSATSGSIPAAGTPITAGAPVLSLLTSADSFELSLEQLRTRAVELSRLLFAR